ncbi:MAG: transglycosylase SLT domain-containing protein [Dysgonamonadaceae bacterium]|nr:transglycosylase SLT domain-containing protein [Dysgonamonadaceae bacterium]
MKFFLHTIISLCLLFIFLACKQNQAEEKSTRDFPQIVENDTLRVLTLNTSTSFFIYRDQPMGYHYEMISDFCLQHNLVPEIIIAHNASALLQMLLNGEGDVVAYNIPVTNALRDSIIYCGLEQISHQVLVQRAGQRDTILTDVTKLIGKTVTVIDNSKYHDRIVNLNNELGGGIIIETISRDTVVVEDLIRMVSNGVIRYTIADDYLARANQTYFRNLNVDLALSFDQRSSWIVQKNTPILADSLNSWFERANNRPIFQRITKRYFEEAKGYSIPGRGTFPTLLAPGTISIYDHYFKKFGKEFDIDWRLLAAISFQESRFDPEGHSWAGATGLMGLMPATAASFGVSADNLTNPETNIRIGAKYLKYLLNIFSSVENPTERLKLSLAAYNGGIGHIMDARALAQKYGANRDVWNDNVEKYVLLKRLERYYEDPVTQFGFLRGDETVNYVRNVMSFWEMYQGMISD